MGEHGEDGEPEESDPAAAPSTDSPSDDADGDVSDAEEDVSDTEEDAAGTEADAAGTDEGASETDEDPDGTDEGASETDEDPDGTDESAESPDDGESVDESDDETDGEVDDETDADEDGLAGSPGDAAGVIPSAEEWLEEHGGEDEAPGMTEADLERYESEGPNATQIDEVDLEPVGTGEDAAGGSVSDDDGTVGDDDGEGGDATEGDDATEEDDAEVPGAEAREKRSAAMSTSDPGSNAPAGMGAPTPAGASGGGGTTASSAFPDFDADMAPDDQEQPLTEHIEEMTYRFLFVALVMALVAAVALVWSDDMINFLWYSFLGPDDGTCPGPQCPLEWRPHIYHPLSLVLARLKMAALVGFVAGLPVAVYQTYRFMRPGLYPHERRYYLAAVPTSLVLAIVGVGFAYFIVLPSLFIYFSAYSTQAAELAFALSDTFNLMVMLMGFFALIFQIPLLVMLAIMMGVTTRRWLEQRRIYFWTGFGGVAFLFSPDPTGMAPLLVAVTMIALFEGTLLLLRWTERSVALFSAKTLAANRPYAWGLAALVGYVLSSGPIPETYFGSLPPVFVETLTEWGYVGLTPAIIAVTIIATFELLGTIARRIGAGRGVRQGLRVRLAFIRARPAVWLLAIVVGYAGSPDPELFEIFREISYPPAVAVGVAVGLIVAYEALRVVLASVRPE